MTNSNLKKQFCDLIMKAGHINACPNINPDPPGGIPLGIGDACFNDADEGLMRGFSTALQYDHPRNGPKEIHYHLKEFPPFEISPEIVMESTSLSCSIVHIENSGKDIATEVSLPTIQFPASFALLYELKPSKSSAAALIFEPTPAKGYCLRDKELFSEYIRINYQILMENVKTVFPYKDPSSIIFLTSLWHVSKYAIASRSSCSESLALGSTISAEPVGKAHGHWGTWHNSKGSPALPSGVWTKANATPDGGLGSVFKKTVEDRCHAISDIKPIYDSQCPFTVMFGGYITKEKTLGVKSKNTQEHLIQIEETDVSGIECLCIITGTYIEEAMDFVIGYRRSKRKDKDEDDGDDSKGGGRSGIKKLFKNIRQRWHSKGGSGSTPTSNKGKGKEVNDSLPELEGIDGINIALNYILAMSPAERAMVHTTQVLGMLDAVEQGGSNDLVDWLLKARPKVSVYDDKSGFASFAVGEFERELLGNIGHDSDDSQDNNFDFSVRRNLDGDLTIDSSFALSDC